MKVKDWTARAACRNMPVDMFTMSQSSSLEAGGLTGSRAVKNGNRKKFEEAKEVCDSCPVQAECLSEASPVDLYWTVRGGKEPGYMTSRSIPSSDASDYIPYKCSRGHIGDHLKGSKYHKTASYFYCKQCYAERQSAKLVR